MFGRIANILGWAGVALVLAGVATWLTRPATVSYTHLTLPTIYSV